MSNYKVWTTKDGRKIDVLSMSDLHLLHTLRAIESGDLFKGRSPLDMEAENWRTILKGEALRRGLDTTIQPSRREGLLFWLFSQLKKLGYFTDELDTLFEEMKVVLRRHNIKEPELDISNLDGKPSYLHWVEGPGRGTPLDRDKASPR